MTPSVFRALARLWASFRRRQLDSILDDEIEAHVNMLSAELEKEGLSPDRARREARVRFGNRQAARELHRETRSLPLVETIWQDVRYVLRAARGNKTFTAVAVGCLALGIGANTTVFSVMESILFRPLPVERPEELVVLRLRVDRPPTPQTSPIRVYRGPMNQTDEGFAGFVLPYPFFERLREENDVFAEILARQPLNGVIVNNGDGNDATMADGTYVSAGYFTTLGIRPVAGRFFTEDDDQLNSGATIVLGRAFADARFGRPEAAIGQSLRLNDVAFTVVGVTSEDFHGLDPSRNPAFFVPLATGPLFWDTGSGANSAEMRVDARDYWINTVGRLRNGVSRTQAETVLAQRFDAFARNSVDTDAQLENVPSLSLLDAGNGTDVLRVRYQGPLYVLAAMVALILAVACANLANVAMRGADYTGDRLKAFYTDLRRRLLEIPGVEDASMSWSVLADGGAYERPTRIPGTDTVATGVNLQIIGEGFFRTLGIPIVRGRPIRDDEFATGRNVTIIDERFAETHFPGEDPIGRTIDVEGEGVLDIVGVAANARHDVIRSEDTRPVVYYTLDWDPHALSQMTFELRTAGTPSALTPALRLAVRELDPRVVVTDIRSQNANIDGTISQEIAFSRLCGAFALLALVIACVGLYGTMTHNTMCRVDEIGVRMALGAQRRTVMAMVLREVLMLGLAGVVIGVPASLAASRFIETFLWGISPNDATTIAVAIVTLLVAVLVAGYAPAWRASRIDPNVALRYE